MNRRVKRLPRLWCAMQGLLPLEACLAAQRGELAWPAETGERAAAGPKAERPTAGLTRKSAARAPV